MGYVSASASDVLALPRQVEGRPLVRIGVRALPFAPASVVVPETVRIIERDNGTLYCTAVFIDPETGYVAKHRKLVPTAMERTIWGQGDGTTLPVLSKTFESASGQGPRVQTKVSATICW